MKRFLFLILMLLPVLLLPLRVGRVAAPAVVMLVRSNTPNALPAVSAVLATGSGVLVHPRGYLITSSHILGRGKLYAWLPDPEEPFAPPAGTLYRLSLIRKSSRYDLALLRITARYRRGRFRRIQARWRCPFIHFADSTVLEPLDRIYSFGYPELSRMGGGILSGVTAFAGRVAALDHSRGWIKAVLPVSPGYSGGPVCNRRGQLVGIITAVKLDRESQARLALIRPADVFRRLLEGTPPALLFNRLKGRSSDDGEMR